MADTSRSSLTRRCSHVVRAADGRTMMTAEDQLRAVLDGVSGAFIQADAQANIWEWSPRAETLLGFTDSEARGANLVHLVVDPDDRIKAAALFRAHLETGAHHSLDHRLELEVRCKSGTKKVLGITGSAMADGTFAVFLNDITERATAKIKLQESNALLQSILDNTNAVIFAKDLHGRYIFVNNNYADLYGLSANFVVGKTEFDLTPLEQALATQELDRQTLEAGEPITVRRTGALNGNPERVFVSTRFVLRHDDGTPYGICGIAIDDTQRDLNDRALRESEERYQRTIANAPGMAYRYRRTINDASIIDFVSEGSRAVFGLDPQALVEDVSLLINAIHDDDREEFLASSLATMYSLAPWRWQGRIKHTDGRYRWVQAVARPSRMQNGDTVWDGLMIDRTHEREVERALSQTRLNFDRMMAQLQDFVFTLEILPTGDVKGLYASPDASGIFGDEIAIGSDFFAVVESMVVADDLPLFQKMRRQLIDDMRAEQEYRIVGLDGRVRWIWTRLQLRHDGERRMLDGICSDVSDHRQLMTELNTRNAQLEDANQFKLDVIGMLSHDIGSPLTSIMGYADLMLDDDNVSGFARSSLETIRRSASVVENIRREALTMCSIDAGKLEAERQMVNVAAALRAMPELADSFHLIAVDDALNVSVHPVHFAQIIGNFVSNAQKYAGGITAITAMAADEHVEVSVVDSGGGIADDFRNRIFERFSRSDSNRPDTVGTGIGLFIVKSLAEANHGSVRHEHNQPTGSRFVVRLEQL